ncbi:hypothetical protein SDJN03_01470, partial [Cucurbita argyrosperma subsp. sororia]
MIELQFKLIVKVYKILTRPTSSDRAAQIRRRNPVVLDAGRGISTGASSMATADEGNRRRCMEVINPAEISINFRIALGKSVNPVSGKRSNLRLKLRPSRFRYAMLCFADGTQIISKDFPLFFFCAFLSLFL